MLRLGHPFPSLLNASATLAIATLAGAPGWVSLRLAASMLALQVSIGALNDLADAARDAGEKPGKPLPSGAATERDARSLTLVGLGLGLALSAPSGLPVVAVAALGACLGYAYDLRLSRTPWSWLPLALALPLVPIHAWLGASGSMPPGLLALVPAAVLAGGALAIANGLVDLERDARSTRRTIAVALGGGKAWLAHAVLLAAVAALGVFVAPAVASDASGAGDGPLPIEILRGLRTWGVAVGLGALGLGALALAAARPAIRERGWELEAGGVAGIGVGWLAGAVAS